MNDYEENKDISRLQMLMAAADAQDKSSKELPDSSKPLRKDSVSDSSSPKEPIFKRTV